ncbi:MAG: hypothetical protein H6732_01550 [Alphaproteobacteria bacterium]|nr:hypothetical protein [Alphaproteobacteria bacterium]
MSRQRTGLAVGVLVAGAFVAGLVAGGLGPRAEVRALRAELLDAEREVAREGRAAAASDLTDLIVGGVRSADQGRPLRDRGTGGDPVPLPTPAGGEEEAGEGPRSTGPAGALGGEGGPAEDGGPGVGAMQDALAVRRVQARAALVEDARPTAAQLESIDAALLDMNDELEGIARELVSLSAEGRAPGRRDVMRLGADVFDVLVVTEERMLEALEPDQRAALREESTDPTSFVDPAILGIVGELERGRE